MLSWATAATAAVVAAAVELPLFMEAVLPELAQPAPRQIAKHNGSARKSGITHKR